MLLQRVSAMSHASIKYAAVADRLQGGESPGMHQRTRRIAGLLLIDRGVVTPPSRPLTFPRRNGARLML